MRVQLGLGLASCLIAASTGHAAIISLTVDPSIAPNGTTTFSTISSAVNVADGDLNANNTYNVRIASGTYQNDFATVTRPMSLVAISGPGTVTMLATTPPTNEKGIILNASDLTVDGLIFQGAATTSGQGDNGAGIRYQSTGATLLRVENSQFIGNQNGVLTAGSGNQETVQILNFNLPQQR